MIKMYVWFVFFLTFRLSRPPGFQTLGLSRLPDFRTFGLSDFSDFPDFSHFLNEI